VKRHIVVIQGHPDRDARHFGHALADAYERGAVAGGHEVRRIDVAALDFPLVRSRREWEEVPPPPIQQAQASIAWADHLCIIHPLWLGSMPALLKGFLEQVFREGFALRKSKLGAAAGLRGRSARVIVTMGMPALLYRFFFLSHGVRSMVRSVLRLTGFGPVRTTMIGSVERGDHGRKVRWLERIQSLGHAAR
jgi:putative NADPH-quinone reductase